MMIASNYLLVYRFGFKVIGPLEENAIRDAKKFFSGRGYAVWEVGKPPAARTLRRWKQAGRARATDSCVVQGLCSCEHGCRSWLAVYKEKMKA